MCVYSLSKVWSCSVCFLYMKPIVDLFLVWASPTRCPNRLCPLDLKYFVLVQEYPFFFEGLVQNYLVTSYKRFAPSPRFCLLTEQVIKHRGRISPNVFDLSLEINEITIHHWLILFQNAYRRVQVEPNGASWTLQPRSWSSTPKMSAMMRQSTVVRKTSARWSRSTPTIRRFGYLNIYMVIKYKYLFL